MPLDVYADDTIAQLLNDVNEISFEGKYIRAGGDELDATFEYVNNNMKRST
jgi:hypothetical protein